MEADRDSDPMKNYTADELAEMIDRSLKQTAEDVREGRVPLDGRARLLMPKDAKAAANQKPTISDAAE
jgi:hypothetical protein